MISALPLLCVPAGLYVLFRLCVIDLRVRRLPNPLVLSLALLGLAFHFTSAFYYASPQDMILGALLGGGSLALIRAIGNTLYQQDTLGLGDVKLLAAEGLWLGAHDTTLALVLGAGAGLLHGLALLWHAKITRQNTGPLATFSLPAGPGFIAGFIITALAKFWGLPHLYGP